MSALALLGWGSLGLLVGAGVALMFWLDWLLGAIFAAFVFLVLWYVFGVYKKKVDRQIGATARLLNLALKSHPIRYASMVGGYQGHPVRISYESSRTLGLGFLLVAEGAPPGLAALDARNITLVRMGHNLSPQAKRLLEAGPPPVLVQGKELRLILPGICTDPIPLREALRKLHQQAKTLAQTSGGEQA